MLKMKRREFITVLGGATVAWPLAARAQQGAMPVIGFLDAASAAERTDYMAAFRQGLAQAGYVDGQNVAFEYRWAEGRYDRLPELAADLVRRPLSVIVTPGTTAAAQAAKAATATIPIVFGVGGDPVQLGLVASLNRPGSNATGVNFFTTDLVAKRMELFRELVPGAKRVAVLLNPTDHSNDSALRDVETAAIGQQVLAFEAATGREIDAAFAGLARERQAGGPAGDAADEVRAGDQSQHCACAPLRRAADAARPRRRGDRIGPRFAAVHESAFGTKRTRRHVRYLSAFRGKADIAIYECTP